MQTLLQTGRPAWASAQSDQHPCFSPSENLLIDILEKLVIIAEQGHHRHASETPFKWRFAGGPMLAHL